ncbi:MAG: ribonuclease Z [Candidatus Thermoplasmatota archaeon]
MDMKVTLLGTSGGIPIPQKAQSGVLVETQQKKILLDCGMGVPLRMAEVGVSVEEIDIVCLTHEHLDHIQDLPGLVKASRLKTKEASYTVVVPPGLKEKLLDFCTSADKPLLEDRRVELDFEEIKSEKVLEDQVSIKPFDTLHTDMSQGYKVSLDGKEMVYTGDTEASEQVKQLSERADLLIHELSYLEETEGHTHPDSLVSIFGGTSVNDLLLDHFYPEAAERSKEVAEKIERETGIRTSPGSDLQSFRI